MDIQSLADAQCLEEVLRLRPVTYFYRKHSNVESDDQQQLGLIAQEVNEIDPRLVVLDQGGQPYAVLR